MPLKTAKAAAPSRKPRAAPKTVSKAAPKKKAAASSKSSKRRRAPSPTPESVPIWDQNITTQAQRNKKRFKLSMRSMHEEIDEEYIANMAVKLIGESRDTWGIPEQEPLKAIPGKKTAFRRAPATFQETEEKWMSMMQDMQSMMPVPKPVIPNSPERSPILRIALEVREVIYKHLLVRPKPILLKTDWSTVERNPFVDHSIVLVCRQFAIEASAFIYKNSTFQALLRKLTHQARRYEAPTTIATVHHANFRNLVIDCSRDCWNLDCHEQTAKGLTTLISTKAMINSLTINVNPQQVGMSETALGSEATPITFADFLWYYGPLMTAIRGLAPRVLKIVVKKGGMRRFGMQVETKYLQLDPLQEGPLANRESIRLRKAQIKWVEHQLMFLKTRLECIFQDDRRAVMEGLCTVLMNEEVIVKPVADRAVPMGPNPQPAVEAGGKKEPIDLCSDED
jgi:hypothetical protein